MIVETHLHELFTALNLPRAAAAAYFSLLCRGPMKPDELANHARLDAADCRSTIEVLRTLRLIGNDRGLLYAAEPAFAWMAIATDLVWGQRTTLASIRELPTLGDAAAELMRRRCEELAALARDLYTPYSSVRQHRVIDADTWDQFSFLTCELIARANGEVVAVSKSPRSPQLASFWAVLTDRLDHHGVRYRRVADLDEVEAHGLRIINRDMDDHGIDLRVLERERIQHEFYAVDGKFLAVAHQPAASSTRQRRGVGRVTNRLDIVRRYCDRFVQYFMESIPASFVVARLAMAADALIVTARRSLLPYQVSWLRDIVDYGKFSKFHVTEGWSSDKAAMVEETATNVGLVRRNPYGELVPAYGVSEESLRHDYSLAVASAAQDSGTG